MKKTLKRISNIDFRRVQESDINKHGIYIKFDEEDIMKGKALIIGPKDTLYEDAFLLFSFIFPNNYPFSPPTIIYHSQNNIRIHPNIYVNGKVCLSILGTWSGPEWTSAMDIINVFVTIQSLLDNNPLHNEPGYEKKQIKHNKIFTNYNLVIEYNTLNSLILNNLNNDLGDFNIFKSIMVEYFIKNKENIKKRIDKNKDINYVINVSLYNISEHIDYNMINNKYVNYLKKFE
jgi:ubiquitin-protein ligase